MSRKKGRDKDGFYKKLHLMSAELWRWNKKNHKTTTPYNNLTHQERDESLHFTDEETGAQEVK